MTDGTQGQSPSTTPGQTPPRPPMPPARGREGGGDARPTSFYVAIFVTLLLFVSAGLNVVLLFVALFSSSVGSLGTTAGPLDDSSYDVVSVGGDRSARKRVLRIPVEGAIAEQASPLIGAAGGTVSFVKRHLELAARDSSIVAVLLDINSPGGGVTASDEIHRLIRKFDEENDKPVVAMFGDMAASGGYYIAAACDEIWARPTTITGSIGVIISTLNYAEALEKIGVSQDPILDPRTPHKDMLSPSKKADEEEIAIVRSIVSEMYERFVEIVDEGREQLDRDQVIALADGRIYSAQQALDNGLVDRILDTDEAFARIRELAEVDEANLVEYRRKPNLADLLFGAASTSVRPAETSFEQALAPLLRSTTGPRFLYFWPGGR
jgi:protease-4